MKLGKHKVWVLLALIVCCALLVALVAHQPKRVPAQWVHASVPVFSVITNANGPHQLLSVVVSNGGPTSVDVRLRWFDCKVKTERALSVASASLPLSRTLIESHAATSLSYDFSPNVPRPDYLCCCQFEWQQHPTWRWRASSRWVDPALAWLQNCFQPGWRSSTWSLADWLEPLLDGLAFTSNIEVDDYFRTFYGLDRQHPAGEGDAQRRPPVTNNAAADQVAASPLPVSIDVRRAFNSYCVAMSLTHGGQN